MTNELLSSLSILHVHIKDKDFNVDKVTLSFRTKMEAPRLVLVNIPVPAQRRTF